MSASPGPMEQSSILPSDPGRVPSLSWTPFPCTPDAEGGQASPAHPPPPPRPFLWSSGCSVFPPLSSALDASLSMQGIGESARGEHCSGAALDHWGDVGSQGKNGGAVFPRSSGQSMQGVMLGCPPVFPTPVSVHLIQGKLTASPGTRDSGLSQSW